MLSVSIETRVLLLLVINCNLGPISHRFRDMASYWFKIAKFSYPLSFRAFDWGDPYGIFGKVLQILKLGSLGTADGEDLMILACTVFAWSTRVTHGQTELRWLRCAIAVPAVARKNIAELQSVTCRMGSHNVSWYSMQVNKPRLNRARYAGDQFTHSVGMEGWVSYVSCLLDCLPVCRQLLIHVVTTLLQRDYESNPRPLDLILIVWHVRVTPPSRLVTIVITLLHAALHACL